MAFKEVLGQLSVVLGMDTAAFSTGSARAKKEVSTLERHVGRASKVITAAVTTMMGSFVVDQIVRVTKAGLEYASSLGEVAAQLGVTTKTLQEYRYAAGQTGIEQGDLEKGLAKLSIRIGQAANGNKSAAALFDRLGISVRDANGNVRDTGDIIPEIAEKYKSLGSQAQSTALAAEVFGAKLGPKFAALLEGGAAGVRTLTDEAHRFGLVLTDKQIKDADNLADNLGRLKTQLEVKLAGVVADNAGSILELANALSELVDAAGKAAKAWRYFTSLDFSWNAPSLSKQFEAMAVADLGQGVQLTRAPTARELRQIAANKMRDNIDRRFLDSGGSLLTAPKRGPSAPVASPWGAALNTNLNRRAVGGSAFGGLNLSQFAPGSGTRGWMTAANDQFAGIAAKSKEAETAVANMANVHGPKLVASIKKAKPELENLRSATQSILDRLFPETAEVNRYREELATLTAALKAGQLTTEDYAKAVDALRQEFTGFTDLIAQNQEIVAEGVGTTLDDALDAATASWDRFADGLSDRSDVTRVEVVKNFDQMAQDVLSSLGQLSGAIRGGGFLDILSGVLGLGLQVAGLFRHNPNAFKTPTPPVINNFRGPAYANGTSFHRGGLAVVGERGPELVNLPRGVGVTPNKDLRGMGGGIAEIVPSKYFDVVVDGRIVRASPAIMDGSAKVTASRLGRRQKRQLYG